MPERDDGPPAPSTPSANASLVLRKHAAATAAAPPEQGAGGGRSSGSAGEREDDAWKYSPVPLRKEEAENAEVRRLAAKLAPTFEKADALFVVPSEFQLQQPPKAGDGPGGGEDDDSIGEEVEALRYSELALRQELELASDFSTLFSKLSPSKSSTPGGGEHEEEDRHGGDEDDSDGDAVPPRRLLLLAGAEADADPAGDRKAEAAEDALGTARASPAGPAAKGLVVDAGSLSPDSLLSPIPIPARTPDHHNNGSSAGRASAPGGGEPASPWAQQLDEILIPAFSSPGSGAKRRGRAAAATTPPGSRAPEDGDEAAAPRAYTRSDHFSYLGLGREEHTWYSIDWTRSLVPTAAAAAPEAAPQDAAAASLASGCVKEYCVTIPDAKLRAVFAGLPEQHARGAAAAGPVPLRAPQPLPVRTLTIRIRGDVLCGAVMDAVAHALVPGPGHGSHPMGGDGDPASADETFAEPTAEMSTSATALLDDDASSADGGSAGATVPAPTAAAAPPPSAVHIQKRQGGHLQAIVGGSRVSSVRRRRAQSVGIEDDLSLSPREEAGLVTEASVVRSTPPFFLDAQLVTRKSEECDRVLLVRVYHLQDPGSYQDDLAVEEGDDPQHPDPDRERGGERPGGDEDDAVLVDPRDADDARSLRQCLQLREACAMIQRVESPRKARRIRVPPGKLSGAAGAGSAPPPRQVLQETVSDHLLRHYLACPSVKDGSITLPSLNPQDWPVLVASWPWIKLVWDELESRDLSYHTLLSSRFGSFPALPTLDVHYCSQIRRLSREDMVVQLLRSASELEDYAREAEYACANMISLLQPTFETYGVDPPALPKPTPLTAYPLNFVAPQQSFPPWGQLVMEALNQIQAWTKDDAEASSASIWDPVASLSAEEAAKSVEHADSAVRLVLAAFQKQDDEEKGARLGRKNLQVMDRLAKMQEHERQSILTLSRSHLTCDKARKAADDFAAKSGGVREVPLLKWSIVVGGATGTCLVTASHILFVTQLIPYIGGSKSSLFRLQDVDFVVQDAGTPSLLNPLPTIISLKRHGDEVYSFRPSSGGARLKGFLDLLQSIDVDAA